MKKIIFFLVMLGVMACSKQTSTKTDSRVVITTEIMPFTRISTDDNGQGGFTSGDVISLAVSEAKVMEFTIGETELFWHDLDLPSEAASTSFSGCFPPLSQASGMTGIFQATGSSDEDLLLAPSVSVKSWSESPVNLSFYHALHRLRILYTSDGDYTDEELQNIQTTCTSKSACEVNLAAGKITKTLEQTSSFQDSSAEAVFNLPPQETSSVTISVDLSGSKMEFNLAELLEEAGRPHEILQGGTVLEVTVCINKEGISLGDMTIGGWDDQGSTSGEIIL